ncbi:rhodanese-like domain-containing protein [Paenibacillus filicis]|uniref:Rhodanese-like domain-containing protein n=1 Tax=Paenibacillus filicis TaxID=669464 RepID=A0ABU9DH14_9BACL
MSQLIEGVSHLNSLELQELLEASGGETVVIDVREQEEYDAVHIPGVPLVPMSEIADLLEKFDPAREYVFVCRSGRRSLEVAKFFQANGIQRVHNHLGGMLDWQSQELEVASGSDDQAAERLWTSLAPAAE